MLNTKVALPGVHMAGSDAHYNAHIEVGQHGFALFFAPDAEYPVLDVNGTSEQLNLVVRGLQAALASRFAPNADPDLAAQLKPHRAAPRVELHNDTLRRKAAWTLVHPIHATVWSRNRWTSDATRSAHCSAP